MRHFVSCWCNSKKERNRIGSGTRSFSRRVLPAMARYTMSSRKDEVVPFCFRVASDVSRVTAGYIMHAVSLRRSNLSLLSLSFPFSRRSPFSQFFVPIYSDEDRIDAINCQSKIPDHSSLRRIKLILLLYLRVR